MEKRTKRIPTNRSSITRVGIIIYLSAVAYFGFCSFLLLLLLFARLVGFFSFSRATFIINGGPFKVHGRLVGGKGKSIENIGCLVWGNQRWEGGRPSLSFYLFVSLCFIFIFIFFFEIYFSFLVFHNSLRADRHGTVNDDCLSTVWLEQWTQPPK